MRTLPPTREASIREAFIEVETTAGKVRKIAASALLGLLSCALIVAFASIGTPLWIDDFLHFAFGGFPSTVSSSHAIRHSITSINFGQTRLYMLLHYCMLKTFGEHTPALRPPGILS